MDEFQIDRLLKENNLLRLALADIRNRTIVWKRGTEAERLREVHDAAQRALDGNPEATA